MKIGKPDLKTVLTRRRRTDRDFFEERKSLGMTLEQVLSEVTKTYSLSPESLKTLESIFAQKEPVEKTTTKVTEPEDFQNTTIQTNDISEENDNEEPEEEDELVTNSDNKQTNKLQGSKKKSKQQVSE